jgi:thioredoxin reductase
MKRLSRLPIAVVGAGPVGLAAAAELIVRGETPVVFEEGGEVGAAVREWAHVRIFSPWRYSIDPAARQLLTESGWNEPEEDGYPTGGELVDRYLAPLAALPKIGAAIRLHSKVAAISREGIDKMTSTGRADRPFDLRVLTPEGLESVRARAVIDASGTWRSPNPLGADGLAAVGEAEAADRIFYGIPDILGRHRKRYAGRRVLMVGRGHSAFNALLDLMTLNDQEPTTQILWATRKVLTPLALGGGDGDALPERAKLGEQVQSLILDAKLVPLESFAIQRVSIEHDAVRVEAKDGRTVLVDEIVCATGYRPDLSLTSELRLKLDEIVEAPISLAPLIDPNVHSCGTVPPHGEAELAHPEKGYYTVGMKSYGRAPTFLMLTGYEQVRSIACALTGDAEGARKVELVLPNTGVCSTDLGRPAFSGTRREAVHLETANSLPIVAAQTSPCCEGETNGGGCCLPSATSVRSRRKPRRSVGAPV